MSATRIARVTIDERKVSQSGSEQTTGNAFIEHFAGNPLRLDLFLIRNNAPITDAAVTGVSVSVVAATREGDSFADADSDGFDTAVNAATWAAKTAQSATVNFTGAQLELPIAEGQLYKDYAMVVYFGDYTIGWITLRIFRDDVPTGQLPVQSGNIVPNGATYDGTGHYTLDVVSGTYYILGLKANDTSITNGVDTIDTDLDVWQASGSTVTLNGSAGQAVTMVVRPNPLVTTALLEQIIATVTAIASGTLSGSGSPEGVQVGNVGNTYFDTTNNDFYVKKSGSGNTGWQLLIDL